MEGEGEGGGGVGSWECKYSNLESLEKVTTFFQKRGKEDLFAKIFDPFLGTGSNGLLRNIRCFTPDRVILPIQLFYFIFNYSGDLKYGLVRILNGKKRLGCKWSESQMGSEIRKPNHLKSGQTAAILSKTI